MNAVVRKTSGFQLEFIRQSHMPRLLNILGISDYANHSATRYIPKGSWWERHDSELDWILHDIHAAYRKKAKELRIDLVEHHEQALTLNLAYQKVIRLFANRGICLN